MIDRDRLNSIPKQQAAVSCFNLLRVHQDYPPHVQLVSTCAAFLLLCEAFDTDPKDVFTVTSKVMREDIHQEESDRQFGAVRDYIANEIRKST